MEGNEREMIVAVSGGLDPVHIGHIRLMKEASQYGRVKVILNSDRFLIEKKGYVFMPFDERKEVIEAIKYVDEVVPCIDEDQSVCETLKMLKPDYFVNGGDRFSDNIPEKKICEDHGIKMIFNAGEGGKVESSSELVKNAVEVLSE
ncbi:MAG: adenylyltransferase/cytidyltransferase family protein [Proteobacteria bacterium]|jgi:cytidyltransferase-like protein|nr:adenylyltransferase/cytidyltransferase family protein [Pseudomonadota bacterium]